MVKKTCENCGKDFDTGRKAKYCCPQCYWEAMGRIKKEKATGVIQ